MMFVEQNENPGPRRLPRPPGKGASITEVRAYFQAYKPTLKELVLTGEYGPPQTLAQVLRDHAERHNRWA